MVAQTACVILQRIFGHFASAARKLALRRALFRKALALGPSDVRRDGVGGRVSEWIEGVESLDLRYGLYLPQAIVGFGAPVVLLGFLAWVDWVTALVLLAVAPIPPLMLGAVRGRFKSVSSRYWKAMNALSAEWLDSVHGLVTLKLLGRGKSRALALRGRAEALRRQAMRLLAVNQSVIFFMDCGFALSATGAATVVGVLRWQAGALSPGGVVVAILLSTEMIRQINLVASFFFAGANGRVLQRRLNAQLEREPDVQECACPRVPARPHGGLSIEFERVRFTYPGEGWLVLNEFSLSITPGESIGLIGASGAGKSTLVRLLQRFFDPTAGEIRLAGVPLRYLPLDWLRSQIAVVAQDAHFFTGSLGDNLRMAKPEATEKQIRAAVHRANLGAWIGSLPDGYETKIGERAMRLSGGQAQRLAIARAFLMDAPVLVLDEASANLDRRNESAIAEALTELRRGRTTLVIAHRAGALRGVERIVALREGRAEMMARDEAEMHLVA